MPQTPPPLYQLLFSIEIVHPYFSAPSRLRIRVEPDRETQDWMRRTGCLARTSGNLLQVYFETDRNGPHRATAGAAVGFDLRFGVYAQDREFARYTAGLTPMDRPPLTFCSDGAVEDGAALAMPVLDTSEWPWREGARPDLMLLVSLRPGETPRAATDNEPAVAGRAYRVALNSRESLWKYLLLGDWAGARIVDPGGAVVFEPGRASRLPDGRTVETFVSKQAIPLQERFVARFELHAAAPPGGSPVKRLLPVPAAANLAFDAGSGSALVSEIFVPR